MTAILEIKQPGFLTSVQDLGRFGFQAFGVPVSGALDTRSLRLANALVGNPQNAAGLEIRLFGPTIEVKDAAVRVALVGTSTPIEIVEPTPRFVPSGQSVRLECGTIFRVSTLADSSTCYLAVEGGFNLTPSLGSFSTYLPAKLGGKSGDNLSHGDLIEVNSIKLHDKGEQCLPRELSLNVSAPIRVVLGPQDDYFTDRAIAEFLSTHFTVSNTSNRMGLRLAGPALSHSKGYNIPSDGICAGSIQVPGDGLPIVLLADRQTTGGYPKIATVISTDLPRLGRLMPGQEIQFESIKTSDAEELARREEKNLKSMVSGLTRVSASSAEIEQRLFRENLISGVWGYSKEN